MSSSAASLISELRDARRAIAASSTALQFRVLRTSATSHLTFALGLSIVLYRYDAAECRPLPSALLGATDDLLAAGPHNGKSCLASHAAFATSSLLSTTAEEIGAARRQCDGEGAAATAGGLTIAVVAHTGKVAHNMVECRGARRGSARFSDGPLRRFDLGQALEG